MGLVVSSTTEITEEGENKIRIDTQSTFKSANVLFVLGEEIDEHTMDGRDCKVRNYFSPVGLADYKRSPFTTL